MLAAPSQEERVSSVVDRVVDYGLRSMAKYLSDTVTTLSGVYVKTPDFDHNTRLNPSDPGGPRLRRETPYVGIMLVEDESTPFTMGNVLYEQNIIVEVQVYGKTYTDMVQKTADVKQALRVAENDGTGNIGIILYNFAVPMSGFYANAGTLQIEFGDIPTQYFGPADVQEEDNRKYNSITVIELTAFKDKSATLLENLGNVGLTDS